MSLSSRLSPRLVGLFVIALMAVAPLMPFTPSFWITLAGYIGLASLVAIGLVLLTGVGGMTSFGQAAFVGFGAYATAVLTTKFGFSPWATLPISLIATGLAALAIGLVTVRLSGHYLPLGTIAWGISFFYLFGNLAVLGGYDGISGIPPFAVGPFELIDARAVYYLIWLAVLIAVVLSGNLLDSRTGRAIRALRGGGAFAESFGVDTAEAKLVVFVYAGLLAGLSGWLYAHVQRSVSPSPFGLSAGIEYLLMAVLGGSGAVLGGVVGAGVVAVLNDQLQNWLPKLMEGGGNLDTIVFGIVLVAALQFARAGIWPALRRLGPAPAPKAIDLSAPPLPKRPMGEKGAPLLEVMGVSKRFGGLVAVNEVSFSVRGGEIVGLIGPNGAGKSTTFNLLTGVAEANSGEIRFRGKRIDRLPAREIAARGIGRTFQHVKLVPGMTVLENVAIGAHLRARVGALASLLRLDRAREAEIIAEAARQIARVGLAKHMHKSAGSLALGQARVAEIARALSLDPALLLLDEPAAGLRHGEKKELAALLRQLRADGMSVLLVEHDMDFVMQLTDHIVVLDFGAKIAEGAPQAIAESPVVLEAYLGGVA
jgi:branched-chain amino acid transport system permease protein